MIQVTIPKWRNSYTISNKVRPIYYTVDMLNDLPKTIRKKWNEAGSRVMREGKTQYLILNNEKILKNSRKAFKPNLIRLSGNQIYSQSLHYTQRASITTFFHNYFKNHIKEQILQPIDFSDGKLLSISCDIYELNEGQQIDASNMWLLEKFFEDSLTELGVIPDDNPKYVIESGRKRYHWVSTAEERKLVFTIKFIYNESSNS